MILKNYQIDAVNKLRDGCILCGGVGSGKSRTALAYYYKEYGGDIYTFETRMKSPPDLYIITTARKRDTLEWEGEFLPFLLSPDPVKWPTPYKHKVVIDSWNNISKYVTVENAFFIFDEQRVVGYGTWSKSFIAISKHNRWILLSATPGDTWMDYVPVFIANGFYKNKTAFVQEHVVYKRALKYPVIDRYLDTDYLVKLRDSILVDMDFKRETVSHHEDYFVNFDQNKYKEVMKTRWNPYEDFPIMNASELCYVLRKIVNTDESRQVAIQEIFEKHPKLIVFYNFDYELDILKSIYYGKNVQVAEWNGHKHQPIPENHKWVYLVQYTAGSDGWNCIKTDTIVFYSQNYSYKTMVQASGRIDRMNTPFKDLYYEHLMSRSHIDLAIRRALNNKKQFNERKYYGKFFEK